MRPAFPSAKAYLECGGSPPLLPAPARRPLPSRGLPRQPRRKFPRASTPLALSLLLSYRCPAKISSLLLPGTHDIMPSVQYRSSLSKTHARRTLHPHRSTTIPPAASPASTQTRNRTPHDPHFSLFIRKPRKNQSETRINRTTRKSFKTNDLPKINRKLSRAPCFPFSLFPFPFSNPNRNSPAIRNRFNSLIQKEKTFSNRNKNGICRCRFQTTSELTLTPSHCQKTPSQDLLCLLNLLCLLFFSPRPLAATMSAFHYSRFFTRGHHG
jgi:hypothetical protein